MTNILGLHNTSVKKTALANYPQYFKQETDRSKLCFENITSFQIPEH
jgi:hypothetical protein